MDPRLSQRIDHAVTDRQRRVYGVQRTLVFTHLGVAMAAFLASALSAVFVFPVIDATWARLLAVVLYALLALATGAGILYWYYKQPPRLEGVHQVRPPRACPPSAPSCRV